MHCDSSGFAGTLTKPSALSVALQLSNFALTSNITVLFVFVVVAMEINMRDYFQSNHIFIMHSLGSNPVLLLKKVQKQEGGIIYIF